MFRRKSVLFPRSRSITSLLLVLFLVITGCSGSAPSTSDPAGQPPGKTGEQTSGQPKRGGSIIVATHADLTHFDPKTTAGLTTSILFLHVYNRLVTIDPDLNFVPELAEKWETPDPNTVIFTLRKGVKFHDGTDFDAEAVKFNMDRLVEPDTVQGKDLRVLLKSVEALDPYKVKFTLSQPAVGPVLEILTKHGGSIASPTAVKQWGNDYKLHPVGTGPFKFVDWKRDEQVVVERFDGYWEPGLPYLDKITFKPMPDVTVRTSNLRSGTVDFMYQVHPRDLPILKKDPKLTVLEGSSINFKNIFMNTNHPKLKDPRVRQALALAVDRQGLMKGAFMNTGEVLYGPLLPKHWAFDPKYKPFPDDMEQAKAQAKALLTEAGYPAGLQIDLQVVNIPTYQQIAQAIRAQWDAIGVTGEIKTYETATLMDMMLKGEFTAVPWYMTGGVDPDGSMYTFFHPGGTYNPWVGKYDNPEVTRTLEQARQTQDQKERTRMYQDAQKMMEKDPAMVFMQSEPNLYAYRSDLKGFVSYPESLTRFKSAWLDK